MNQNGGGTPGRGGAFYMSHQNATKASSPSGVSHGVTLGQVCWCMCVYMHTYMLCSSLFFCACCLPFPTGAPFPCSSSEIIFPLFVDVHLFMLKESMTCFSDPLQGTLNTAVQPPTNVRSPRGDASRARPAAS